MGTIIRAKCACGFDSGPIFQGGGFSNYKTIDMEPAICLKCNKFLVRNYFERPIKCQDCGNEIVFYNDSAVQANKVQNKKENFEGIQWGSFRLPNTTFLCPECGKMTLTFITMALWD